MSTEYCPGTDYQSPHQTLLDHGNGCVVCTSCSRVLEEGLSYNELYSKKALEQKPNISSSLLVDGDFPIEYLNKVGDGLHLCQSTINNGFEKYLEIKRKMQKMLPFQQKNKRILLDDKNLLVYSLYATLKQELCPRPIKEICWHAGNISHKNIFLVEKFLYGLSKHGCNNVPRLKPISAKDIIYSHYPYVQGLTFEDVKQVLHLLNGILPCNFSALVTAAGIVYLYVNYIKKSEPLSLHQISNLFRVTEVSIRRFVTKFKYVVCSIN